MSTRSEAAGGTAGADSGPTPAGDGTTAEPSRDELFHVLRNRRRRFALHYLEREDRPVDVGELATQVAAWENEVPVEAVTSEQRRRVYNALQQTHVPELAETGLVEVDRRDVRLTDRAADLEVFLEVVEGPDVPWSEYYLGLSLAGVALVAATALNLGPFAAVPGVVAGSFLAAALFVSACANYYDQRDNRVGGQDRPPELRGD